MNLDSMIFRFTWLLCWRSQTIWILKSKRECSPSLKWQPIGVVYASLTPRSWSSVRDSKVRPVSPTYTHCAHFKQRTAYIRPDIWHEKDLRTVNLPDGPWIVKFLSIHGHDLQLGFPQGWVPGGGLAASGGWKGGRRRDLTTLSRMFCGLLKATEGGTGNVSLVSSSSWRICHLSIMIRLIGRLCGW